MEGILFILAIVLAILSSFLLKSYLDKGDRIKRHAIDEEITQDVVCFPAKEGKWWSSPVLLWGTYGFLHVYFVLFFNEDIFLTGTQAIMGFCVVIAQNRQSSEDFVRSKNGVLYITRGPVLSRKVVDLRHLLRVVETRKHLSFYQENARIARIPFRELRQEDIPRLKEEIEAYIPIRNE
ncbi:MULTISPECIES: hypothetical protein [Pontibacillus]|uniref:Uncharacterized protein n=1 Tax=Pontibacillus chungwhensis TaxID=265426 RepID=A0ABY8V0N2_9BACI|nr:MULTISPECIES: hypothetical protein [Pontibacillus]MCD5324534.1 hypothetical protein [Pontibacillus sp. HN14]WIF99170.1 hypothetical protein QNI29_05800 [Pontibacillus chungwhensis]